MQIQHLIATAALILATTLSAAQAPPSVRVDAARQVSESGLDDLEAARGIFRGAGFPESNYGVEVTAPFMQQVGTRTLRFINNEYESVLDANGRFVPSFRLGFITWAKRYGIAPHIIVGQRQPPHLPGAAAQWSAAQWARYQDYADKLVRHVAVEFESTGFPDVLFEVTNEVDITMTATDLWTLANPGVGQGDDARYQHMMRLYRVWARAVARVAAENPGRSVRIAGPAMGGQSLFLTGTYWHERFVRDVANENLRLDVLSLHYYASPLLGFGGVPGSSVRARGLRARAALVAAGRGNVPISITEWGPSDVTGDRRYSFPNDTHVGAAWVAAFLTEAIGGTASAGSILLIRNNFGGNQTGEAGFPTYTHIQNGIEYPTPLFNVFRMTTLLPGTRRSVTTSSLQPNVRALVSADGVSAGAMVFNHALGYGGSANPIYDASVAESVTVTFENLAFDGPVRVERHLVDAQTSNVARFIAAGQVPDAAAVALQKVEQFDAAVVQGRLVLDARVLGPSAVSLWLVRRLGPAAASVALTVSPNTAAAGQSVTLRAEVTGNAPSGSVQFSLGATLLAPPVGLISGAATLTTTALPVGVDPITASYSGDANNGASTPPSVIATITPAPTPAVPPPTPAVPTAPGPDVPTLPNPEGPAVPNDPAPAAPTPPSGSNASVPALPLPALVLLGVLMAGAMLRRRAVAGR
ncbi:MAG: Ig-like domain repeat protein [Proteobacteria bacterium]|nr:Ig-like domain repeat protein [Burkholderiales bacterium]